MKTMRYLPLLVLALVTIASAEDGSSTVPADEVRLEIEGILARPALGLADLFRVAELTNPDLAVARANVQARTGRMQQAGLYPNPELTFELGEMSLDEPAYNKKKLELSQDILIGGRRGAAVEAARADVDQAGEMAQEQRRNVLGQIHKWWADQIHFQELDAAFDKMMVEAEQTLDIARTRFEARAAPEAHVTRAMLELYDLQVARQNLDFDRAKSTAEMKLLFGGWEVPVDRLSGNLDPSSGTADLPADADAGMAEHPTLQAARLGVEAAEAMLVTAKKERIPDLNLFLSYGHIEPTDANFVEGGISFPLPLFNRNQGRVAETSSLVSMARYQERAAARELDAALTTARLTHDIAREQMDQLAGVISPAAERSLVQAREAYRAGRLMFLELVDAQRTFNDVTMRTMDLRHDLAYAEADLMNLMGTGPYADNGEVQ